MQGRWWVLAAVVLLLVVQVVELRQILDEEIDQHRWIKQAKIEWHVWQAKYRGGLSSYADSTEAARRFETFAKNLRFVQQTAPLVSFQRNTLRYFNIFYNNPTDFIDSAFKQVR